MKKNQAIFIITIVLLAIAAYFLITNKKGTIKQELKNFAVEDTASVTKIFLADKFGHSVTVERESAGKWSVNKKYTARPDAIDMLLLTMKNMEVRSPVAKAAFNTVIKEIAAKGIKVEIYQHDKLAKTYYVGSATQDQLGTFMYLENSTVPFVIHIPGFEGYLTTRYIVLEKEWRLKSVFDIGFEDISSVIAEDLKQPENSIMITKQANGDFLLTTFPDKKPVEGTEQNKIQNYMSGFAFINYESESPIQKEEIDSIKAAGPFRRLTVTDKNHHATVVTMYRKPVSLQSKQMDPLRGDVTPEYDYDRMLAQINDEPGFIVIQYFVFDRFFKTPSDFLITPSNQEKK